MDLIKLSAETLSKMEFSNQVISLLVLSSPAISYHIKGTLGSPYVVVILRYYYLLVEIMQ